MFHSQMYLIISFFSAYQDRMSLGRSGKLGNYAAFHRIPEPHMSSCAGLRMASKLADLHDSDCKSLTPPLDRLVLRALHSEAHI
jgi:hypothetical protein